MKKYVEQEIPFKGDFQTNYNRERFPVVGESNGLPSKTVPDQTMSLRELVKRFASGLPINGVKVPVYDENPDLDNDPLPDINKLDLAEREELALKYAMELDDLRSRVKSAEQAHAKAEAEAKAALEAEKEAEKKEIEKRVRVEKAVRSRLNRPSDHSEE